MDQKVANGENMPIDRSRESLRSILLGAIDDSCQTNSHELDLNSINTTPYLVSPITNLDMVNQPESFTVVSTTSSDKYSEDTDLQTINDFAWDTGTQTFDNLMWEMGTQTIEDLVMEMGTQTITTFSSSQMEVGGGLDTATKTPTNLTAVQAVDDLNLLMEAQAMASENWEVAKETVDCQALDTGTQTIMGKSMEMESDCELEVNQNTIDKILTLQKESYSSLNMGTQTADNIIATSSTVNMSWETAVKDLKAQTQKGSNTMVWETGDNTDLEIETKTVGDARWATNFPTVDGLGMDTENQTMADVSSLHAMVFKTGTQTQEDMTTLRTQTLPNMRNLHLDNLDFAVGSQTTSGVTWEKTQTMKGSDLDMGTHTMTSIATLQTLDCLSLHMGPQMSSDLPNIQEGEVISYEMGTQTIANMETLQAVDLGMEIGTQTLEQFIRDSHTQTDQIRNWYDDVVTQTEEDLLEFLTRETHTQTGDDLLEFLTRETQTQNSQFGDERAVQTGDDLLEFFSTATQTQFIEAFNAPASMNHIGVETGDDLLEFLTRETETQTQDNINVSNILSS
ncbi:hypothetical protein EGW08_022473 [Elysia chlorotica]|uniref:Uncharacterized protein n=1 Tax=Elysia chlorotica TaxID=188477 RepID=A0A433SKX4_ELYCH|nr:hypothetical protein EGW08_022473 [Elysia chlorotica]